MNHGPTLYFWQIKAFPVGHLSQILWSRPKQVYTNTNTDHPLPRSIDDRLGRTYHELNPWDSGEIPGLVAQTNKRTHTREFL